MPEEIKFWISKSKNKSGKGFVYGLIRDSKPVIDKTSFDLLCATLKAEVFDAIPKDEIGGDRLSRTIDWDKLKNPPFFSIYSACYASGKLGAVRHRWPALTEEEINSLVDYVER